MPVHHLPHYGSSFVGRAADRGSVLSAVRPGRAVTLVGPGGAGKTRLAAEVAAGAAGDWPDGVWWIDLAEAQDDAGVAAAVAGAVGVAIRAGDDLSAVARGLTGRRALLVLDNCEQCADVAAQLVDVLSARAPTVGVLATSRMPTGAGAEHVWRMGPLGLDEAMALFQARARAAGSGEPSGSGIRRICDRLDRLPLALELAAGWTGTLSVDQIAEMLAQPLELLDNGRPSATYRLRTLDGSVRWSHDLLDERQRTVFRRLAVFRRGFTAEHAQQVCADDGLTPVAVIRTVRQLVDMSLLAADTTGDVARYELLEVIGAFARERLAESGEQDAVRDRHLEVYRQSVESLTGLRDRDKDAWRAAVEPDHPNVVAAIDWGLSRPDTTSARELAAGMSWFWHLESRRPDGMRLLGKAVEVGAGERTVVQARTCVALALVADTAAPRFDTRPAAADGLALATELGDHDTARLARLLLAIAAIVVDLTEARQLAERTRADALAAGDVFADAGCAVLLGILCCLRDEYPAALDLLQPAAATLRARGDRGVASTALGYVAIAQARGGALAAATVTAQGAVALAHPLQDLHRIGFASAILAELLAVQARVADAEAVLAPIAQLLEQADEPTFVLGWERARARVALWRGDAAEAVAWCRREVRSAGDIAGDLDLTVDTQLELVTALRLTGETDAARGLLDGAAAIADRLGVPRLLAAVAEERGHLAGDADAHHAALAIRSEAGLLLGCVDSLEALAAVAAVAAPEQGVVLAAAAERIRADCGYAARREPALPALSDPLSDPRYAEAAERGRALGPDAVAFAQRMRGPRNRPSSGWGSLTPTERAVVELAAAGRSNPQIAAQLFVTRGTVKTHLAHVYAKLGLTNRTELAAAYRTHTPA